jgi:hypothetical protein
MARPKTDASGNRINKSQSIRDVLAEQPKLKTREVVAQLAEKGIKVTPTLVYYIKSRQRIAKRRQKRERIAESSKHANGTNPVGIVVRVKELAREIGGIETLKQLVDVLAE